MCLTDQNIIISACQNLTLYDVLLLDVAYDDDDDDDDDELVMIVCNGGPTLKDDNRAITPKKSNQLNFVMKPGGCQIKTSFIFYLIYFKSTVVSSNYQLRL